MKSITLLLSFLAASTFATANPFICSTGDCGGGTTLISSAPVDGSTFYVVWFISSANTPLSATASSNPSATRGSANFGTTTITNTSGTNYRISIPATINPNQNKPSVSDIDVTLAYFTAASFPSSAGSASFTFGTTSPLPVEFMKVEANSVDEGISIDWSTASELNNELFVIESSVDGENWIEIGATPGAGNSSTVLNYTFIDHNPMGGVKSFYRVKQIDFDGKYDYSKVVTTETVQSEGRASVSPNPATSSIVNISSTEAISNLEVRNISGQKMEVIFNPTTNQLDVSSLESGMYYITINEQSIKFIK